MAQPPRVAQPSAKIPVALTIAGSDSGGGAGIQADLRTFAFHCVHGTSALTCITAQNTLSVTRVDALPPESVLAQIDAVVSDIGADAIKTGMLLNAEIMAVVAERLETINCDRLVVDPVMVSRTGVCLIDDAAIATLRDRLIPQAAILTPNRYEAQILAQNEIHTLDDMKAAAEVIFKLGSQAVLIKGGGMRGKLCGVDVWFDGDTLEVLSTETVGTHHTHGTGCTISAAMTANLALELSPLDATKQAKLYLTQALHHALAIGEGQGPVGHYFPLLSSQNQK
ncbi:bifunctional hydroxymethylpyrimidine kinase/phosphomethylpyrimidine kinase [Sodalinema gerasimenkoae]|uniref:bifunctional hydroxymethylpyrimidine kinase/phosphomethylpyrimidine kinase n=1 Tax=Sodalinema gerasimenkoae TaxID=2862348 RepID=UPI0013594F80|nr:bifunctional hydroxymethylpyrimidine kinase/phosphomethylpyrimidine kinase [Sodalinema gerasimenkoae]